MLLFVPFTNEADLIGEGQTAEEAFNQFLSQYGTMEEHHESLQRMLQAQFMVVAINEARKGKYLPLDKDVDEDDDSVKALSKVLTKIHV